MSKAPVLILGGRSDIGLAVAHRFAAAGRPIQLAARNAEALAAEKSNIELRHNVSVSLHEFDALDINSHERFVEQIEPPEIAVCAVGVLGDQAKNERDLKAAIMVMRSNYEGPASIMAVLANRFENRGSGTLIGISSVAGDRGRASNYIYGSAKAGLTAFLSGLRNRLAKKGVHVITVKPGFVATKMVEVADRPTKLTATPEEVAAAIEKAVARKRNIIYVKPFWAVIMMVVRNIPEPIFKALKI